ncbi:MAG: FHA domain-containing protein [Chloroflexota bacterium]
MPSEPGSKPSGEEIQSAFLIVDGSRVVPLDKPVINIGRKNDNHIVINNEHVSRYHAQIRAVKGRFVVLDLNSSVGTSVNGEPVTSAFLRPGDVVSLGGVPLIFGQGTSQPLQDAPGSGQIKKVSTGPTDATDIEAADMYLDLFNEA